MSEEKTIEPDVKQENDTKVENNVQDAIPRSRLNEVISQKKELETKLNEMKTIVEEKQRAELEEQGKLSELNSVLAKENEELKVIKTQFESQDTRLRNDALSKLPEDKREKFSSLPTDSLLDVVEELSSVKNNPKIMLELFLGKMLILKVYLKKSVEITGVLFSIILKDNLRSKENGFFRPI